MGEVKGDERPDSGRHKLAGIQCGGKCLRHTARYFERSFKLVLLRGFVGWEYSKDADRIFK